VVLLLYFIKNIVNREGKVREDQSLHGIMTDQTDQNAVFFSRRKQKSFFHSESIGVEGDFLLLQ
jgi:hypothetical protein